MSFGTQIFWIIYVLLVLLNYPIMIRVTANVYRAKNKDFGFLGGILALILSIVFPLTWFAALIFVLIEE